MCDMDTYIIIIAVLTPSHEWMYASKSRFLVVLKVISLMCAVKGRLHGAWKKGKGIHSYDAYRHEATSAIWQETYLSAVLRAILYSDDSYYRLAGYRKIDPITGLQGEAKFLEAVEALFWKGK